MKATAKCDHHCELHEKVNHLTVERIWFFRVILENMFSARFMLPTCVSFSFISFFVFFFVVFVFLLLFLFFS